MRNWKVMIAGGAGAALLVGVALVVHAGPNVPAGIAWSGVLKKNDQPESAPHDFVFELLDGNTAVCTDRRQALQVTGGRFDVPDLFGSSCALDTLLAGKTLVVRTTVDGQALQPPLPLGTVPFAARARVAESVERPVYVNAKTGLRYSLDAGFCGASGPINANLGGYAKAKTLCEQTCASPTAHMCTPAEIVRFVQTGGTLPAQFGWLAAGIAGSTAVNARDIYDCKGFTSASATEFGIVWSGQGGFPASGQCSNATNVAFCCD